MTQNAAPQPAQNATPSLAAMRAMITTATQQRDTLANTVCILNGDLADARGEIERLSGELKAMEALVSEKSNVVPLAAGE